MHAKCCNISGLAVRSLASEGARALNLHSKKRRNISFAGRKPGFPPFRQGFCAVCGYQRKYAIRLLRQRTKTPKLKRGPNLRIHCMVRSCFVCLILLLLPPQYLVLVPTRYFMNQSLVIRLTQRLLRSFRTVRAGGRGSVKPPTEPWPPTLGYLFAASAISSGVRT